MSRREASSSRYFVSKHYFLNPETRGPKNAFGYRHESEEEEEEEEETLYEPAIIESSVSLLKKKKGSIL